MRVLFWTEMFWPGIGGVEVLASHLLPALASRGHQILVVTDDDHGRLKAHDELRGIRVRRLAMRAALRSLSPSEIAARTAEVEDLLRDFAPQLLHLNCLGPTAFFLRRAVSRRPWPLLFSLHSESNLLSSEPTLVADLLHGATWVSAVCSSVLETAAEQVPEIRSRSSIIYNAVVQPEETIRPLPFDPPRILCVGRMWPEKGLDCALEAYARIEPRDSRLRLVLCGDGPERPALEAQARRLGIANRVEFTGWIRPGAVGEMLNSGTMLLMPSRSEALTLSGLEAAMMARPIVAARVGGLCELIEDGVSGLLVEPDDADGFAAAVTSLLEDPERAVRMGQASRQRVQQRFLWPRCVDSYGRLYERLAEEGG